MNDNNETKQCPFCGEEIKANATKCKHCGEFITSSMDTTIGCISGIIVTVIILVLCGVLTIDIPINSKEKQVTQIERYTETEKPLAEQTCAFEVAGVCYGFPFKPKTITYNECLQIKDELGIYNCYASDDSWAGAVKACGGIDNLPTLDDLTSLASDLYATSISLPKINDFIYGLNRDNNKDYLDLFRNMKYSTTPQNGYEAEQRLTMPIELWANVEGDATHANILSFSNHSIYFHNGSKSSSNNLAYACCVVSRKN